MKEIQNLLEEKKDEIINGYAQGQGIWALAQKYNVSYAAMRNFLKRNNVVLRGKGRQKTNRTEVNQ